MLTGADFAAYLDSHLTRSAFRLETLAHYEVESDGDDFAAYLRGDPGPDPQRKEPWLRRLRQLHAEGITMSRVHILRTPLTPYLRYECEWGYLPNSDAGEIISILELEANAIPLGLVDHDFWLLDDQHVVRMHYDDDGRLSHGEVADVEKLPVYRRARDTAMALAQPFRLWWQEHPEEWRQQAA